MPSKIEDLDDIFKVEIIEDINSNEELEEDEEKKIPTNVIDSRYLSDFDYFQDDGFSTLLNSGCTL